jgi:pyruvate formate lyase activating enzyme
VKTKDFGKWNKLALYQEKLLDNSVRCHVCPHNCTIREGKSGLCNARINIDGELYSISYGNPCSVSVDPVEKKPLFHFFPATDILSLATGGCNFRCLNCQNWNISQVAPNELDNQDLSPEKIVGLAQQRRIGMIAFTYTEPTVFYEFMYDTAKIAREKGLKTVIISNGYINRQPLVGLCPYLDAANIDLKCFDDAIYRELTGGKLQPVLDTLKTLKEKHVWLEITNLLIPTYNDNPAMIQNMCSWLYENGFENTPLHFSRFYPSFKLKHLLPTSVEILKKAKEIAENSGLKYVYIGNMPGLQGENTHCPNCKQLLVERVRFTVTKNFIKKKHCGNCGELIPGVWG